MAFFTDKGTYSDATQYVRNDIVEYNANDYVCKVDSLGNNPDNANFWTIISAFQGVYNSATTYNIEDSVEYNEKIYVCYVDSTLDVLPTNTDNWDLRHIGANLSTFNDPLHIIDDFIEHIDPQASDAVDIARYQFLRTKSSRTSAEETELIALIATLRDKLLMADDFNKYQDALQSMQVFLKNNVEVYLLSKQVEFDNQIQNFETIGVYDSGTQYFERNMVSFGDSFYIAKQDTLGNNPTNTTYWQKITTNGDSGILGVLIGTWDGGTIYNQNEGVIYNNEFYVSLVDNNLNNTPLKTVNPNWVYVYMDVSLLQDSSISSSKIQDEAITIVKHSKASDANKIFDGFANLVGYYLITEFDSPTTSDITETIYNELDTVFATRVTEFDTPTSGDITETVVVASESINVRKITKFDTPLVGNIKQTFNEVI